MVLDKFKGQAQKVAGRAQENVGNAVGDEGLQTEGIVREFGDQAQDLYSSAKGKLKGAAGSLSDAAGDVYGQGGEYAQRGTDAVTKTVKDYPFSALLLAGALGLLACLLLGQRG